MAPVITSSEFMPGLQHVSWAMFSPENNFDVPLAFHPVSESASAVLFEKTILTASGLFVSVADWDNKNFKWWDFDLHGAYEACNNKPTAGS